MGKRPRLTELGSQKRQAKLGIFQALALRTAPFLDYKKSNFLSPPSAPPPLLGVAVLNASPTFSGLTDPPARSALRAPPIRARREEEKNLPKRRGWGKKQVRARGAKLLSSSGTREHSGPKPCCSGASHPASLGEEVQRLRRGWRRRPGGGEGEANPAHSARSPERPRKSEAGAQGDEGTGGGGLLPDPYRLPVSKVEASWT